jgi:hypothetical protein
MRRPPPPPPPGPSGFKQPLPRHHHRPTAFGLPLRPADRPRIYIPTPATSPRIGPDGQPAAIPNVPDTSGH